MKTVNSLSGGKTSSYMAVHYPSDYNIFSLVRIDDKDCLWMNGKDEKTRQLVSDKIGCEFIGTAEMDKTIYTILDLEQFLGCEINWVTGKSFEDIIKDSSGYLPNKQNRFCTSEMKIKPIFNFLNSLNVLPVEMNIGYRPEEKIRIEKILKRAELNQFETFKTIVGKRGKNNKWGLVPYRKVKLPLVDDNISKDVIYNFWNDKNVRFSYRNNCVFCVNRNPLMISHISQIERHKVEWAKKMELKTGNTFLNGTSMSKILNYAIQGRLFNEDDFNDCDSGYCAL